MKIALLVLAFSFNSFAGIFPSKIERLSKKFFSRKLDLETSVIISKEVIKENNICIRKQFELWINEYKEMESGQQNEVKSFFTKFDQVIINQAFLSGEASNTVYNLRYEKCYDSSMGDVVGMGNPFRDCVIYFKKIGGSAEVLSGTLPATQYVGLNTKFDFTMQYLNHQTKTVTLNTNSARVFNDVNSIDSEAFKKYVKEGRITRLYDYSEVIPECDFKKLMDIIK